MFAVAKNYHELDSEQKNKKGELENSGLSFSAVKFNSLPILFIYNMLGY